MDGGQISARSRCHHIIVIYDSHDSIMMPPKPYACVQELLPAKFLLNSFRSKILAQNIFEFLFSATLFLAVTRQKKNLAIFGI
jgi:hypothetical protein